MLSQSNQSNCKRTIYDGAIATAAVCPSASRMRQHLDRLKEHSTGVVVISYDDVVLSSIKLLSTGLRNGPRVARTIGLKLGGVARHPIGGFDNRGGVLDKAN